MALRKIIQTEGDVKIHTNFGIIENGTQSVVFPAYIKVTAINGNKTKIVANVNFKGDTHQFNKQYEMSVSVENGAVNFIAQVYAHLKMLPEFDGAVDC